MDDFNLWSIVEIVCDNKEKNFLLNLSKNEYNELDDEVIELSNSLKLIFEE